MAGQRNLFLSFICIASGGLLFGFIIGLNSNVITTGQLLCKDDYTGTVGTLTSVGYKQCYQLSDLAQGAFSCLNLIGATISSLICFRFADALGRKLEIQIGAACYLLGAAVAASSPTLWGICLGFTLYGIGIGFAMHAAPVFIAEISPAEIRGTLVSGKEAVVVLGIFLGFFFGYVFSNIETYGWRFGTGVSAVLALGMELGITFIPQSPRFLVLKAVSNGDLLTGQNPQMMQARSALKFFRQASDVQEVEEELYTMYEEVSASVGTAVAKTGDAFKYPRPLIIGCGIVFLQQVTGQPSVLYYATNIFKSAGFSSTAALSSVGVAFVKLLATLFTVWRVDQYGRRFLLFVGIGMMAVALAILGVGFLSQTCKTPGVSVSACSQDDIQLSGGWGIATVLALMLYVSGYQVGFGPIAWLLISEVFPLKVRGAAMSIAAIVNFTSNITMTLTLKVLQNMLTTSGVFFVYLGMAFVSILFVWGIVPETKGKTLEQIETDLLGKKQQIRDVSLPPNTM